MTRDEIFEHLKGVLVELFELNPNDIGLGANLRDDLDIDSIDAVDLVLKLKELTGKKIPADAQAWSEFLQNPNSTNNVAQDVTPIDRMMKLVGGGL